MLWKNDILGYRKNDKYRNRMTIERLIVDISQNCLKGVQQKCHNTSMTYITMSQRQMAQHFKNICQNTSVTNIKTPQLQCLNEKCHNRSTTCVTTDQQQISLTILNVFCLLVFCITMHCEQDRKINPKVTQNKVLSLALTWMYGYLKIHSGSLAGTDPNLITH